MKTTKLISALLAMALFAALMQFGVFAAPLTSAAPGTDVTVYVTIANATVKLAHAPVAVKDTDGDGKLTINDALTLAHDAHFEGGASAGYASAASEWGLSLTRLWGVENGGSYGYYLNNKSAMGLADQVADGDSIYAFVYTDTVGFSDIYCYFDQNRLTAAAGESLTLTLTSAGYDANWQPVTAPLAGAAITVDGKATDLLTDAEGRVTLTLTEGEHIIGAVHNEKHITPPVCVATVTAAQSPATGDMAVVYICLLALATVGAAVGLTRRKADAA